MSVECPVCGLKTSEAIVNIHLDRGCSDQKRAKTSTGSSQESVDSDQGIPLAEKMRPQSLDEYFGQSHLVGPQGVLRQLIQMNKLPSMILWGPPGVGKTTFAHILSQLVKSRFVEISATSAGINEIKKVAEEAKRDWQLLKRRTVLFLDEIHRFNRSQQDILLPSVERGDFTLIGATTENPSFKLQSALLSRARVFCLEPLEEEDLLKIIDRAAGSNLSSEIKRYIASCASGDARTALNSVEIALSLSGEPLDVIKQALRHTMIHDQQGDKHYDLISAFHKSVRGSDADAALYYLGRMLEAGEDPLYLSRRMMRIASEDVGLADDSCLPFAVAAHTATQNIGMPEANVILAHCAVKLARAPKSVEVYKAYTSLAEDINRNPAMAAAPVPYHLRNAPTKLSEQVGYGQGYKYNPAYKGAVQQEYLPEKLPVKNWLGVYQPELVDSSENYGA